MPQFLDLVAPTREQKDDLVRVLFRCLVELEARVLKGSHNSGKSPSSDGLSKNPKLLRRVSGRKANGQKARDGLALECAAMADVVVQVRRESRI